MGQQNHVDQLCLFNKQTSGIQVPPLFNGTPFRDPPNMFSVGFPNRSIVSQCQSQAGSPMGVLPHQLNMSTYGSPVVRLGNNLSPHPTLQGLYNDTSILTDSNIVQVELSGISHETFNSSSMSEQSNVSCVHSGHGFMSGIGLAPKQVFQENFFGQIPNKGMVGKQVSKSPCKSLMQESCGGQEQVSSSDLSALKLPNTQSACSLGPVEQKILFVTDDSWQPNLGEQGNVGGISGIGRTAGSSDCLSSFPTVQSGSLSALMQTAVAEASSSDTGLQEWSGMSFQNPEISTENQPSNYVHSRGRQNNAIHNTMQNASFPTSKPKLLSQSYSMNFNSQGLQQLNHKFPGHVEIHSGSQLDTSCLHGQASTLDTTYQRSKKHLLNQSHTDGDIVEHRTGTLYKYKDFVQSSEKFYNQLQNQSLPLHVGSHSLQEMFATQGSGASVGEKCNSLSYLGYKDLRFPSKTRGDQLKKNISQIIVCDSTEMAMLGQPNETVVSTGIGSNKVKEGKLSLQMAPSGFKHQRNSKKWQILSMLDAKNTSHQLPVDQKFDIRRSKKRKLDSFDFLPWYKEVTQASLKFPNFSMIELEWCLASNRRSQRVENEAEVFQDSALIHQPKRRLTKSTQLMQQLFPPSPTVIISADAFSNCDSVVYFIARLALGDACNMTCDIHMQSTAGDMLYGKVEAPGISGGKDLLHTMETFICRAERLHADIIRQEERASFLDLKVESQNMEKLATINRLARFHSQGNPAAVDTSKVTPVVLKPEPQRYVVAFPMPKTVPRGVKCLSL
ncbi:hypothetical protein DM860_014006 [Cuscuta australis]|uniref:Uncharacterized protein n=1 Tax=Cuscuta australis TaxID=267555 RepID=A0A328DN65_9ASTE|nr:hypothetical protein DM860_014006 [Cuscuta australis]